MKLKRLARRLLMKLPLASLLLVLLPALLSGQTRGARNLVTIFAEAPLNTDPNAANQWLKQPLSLTIAFLSGPWIPGIGSAGFNQNLIAGGSCNSIYDIRLEDIQLTTSRLSTLIITMNTHDSNGAVLKSQRIYDGPELARKHGAGNLTAPASLGATELRLSSECRQFSVVVQDTVMPSYYDVTILQGGTLALRRAVFPMTDDPAQHYAKLFSDRRNIAGYFFEISRGMFKFQSAGIFHARFDEWRRATDSHKTVAGMIHLLEQRGFRFNDYDYNGDGVVSQDELTILGILNFEQFGGSTRDGPEDGCTTLRQTVVWTGRWVYLRVCGPAVLADQQTEFATLAHELTHTLGAADQYDKGCKSLMLTLMSCTITNTPDYERRTVYLDPFERILLGWLSPLTIPGYGAWRVGSEFSRVRGPLILRNPNNVNEVFLFEFRRRAGYDANVADEGLVVWHVPDARNIRNPVYSVSPVVVTTAGNTSTGTQDGGSKAWKPGQAFSLQWVDGTWLPYRFVVGSSYYYYDELVLTLYSR